MNHSMPPNDPLTVFWWSLMVFLVITMGLAGFLSTLGIPS